MSVPKEVTEYAVRFEHGEVMERPSRELAQCTVDAIVSRGGTATLLTRKVIRTEWEEAGR